MADLAQAAGLAREDLGGDGLLAVYDGQILVFEVWNTGLSLGFEAQIRAAGGDGVALQCCCDACHRARTTPHQCCLLHPQPGGSQESSWSLLTLIRLLLRYWFSFWEFRTAPAAAFAKFQGMQQQRRCLSTPCS